MERNRKGDRWKKGEKKEREPGGCGNHNGMAISKPQADWRWEELGGGKKEPSLGFYGPLCSSSVLAGRKLGAYIRFFSIWERNCLFRRESSPASSAFLHPGTSAFAGLQCP